MHDVLAHLTLSTRQTVPATIRRVLRARGDFDLAEARWAIERGTEFDRTELLDQLRQTAGSTHRLAVSGPLDPLVDILVHGQDIARPLGRVRPMPAERAVPALEYAWQARFYNACKRFAGLRLVATDAEFSAGDGELEVHGPVGELLLTATGRAAGLAGLTGSGLETLTARMAPNGVVSP